jgi:hypothetical protein
MKINVEKLRPSIEELPAFRSNPQPIFVTPAEIRRREVDWSALTDEERSEIEAWLYDELSPLSSRAVVFVRRHHPVKES